MSWRLIHNSISQRFLARWNLPSEIDIEYVDLTSRLNTINEIMEITTKPIIFDGDTGGITEHFILKVKTLERLGVSAIIIEDKIGLKRTQSFLNRSSMVRSMSIIEVNIVCL